MATDDTQAARLLNPAAEDIARADRLTAAQEGVVKALEEVTDGLLASILSAASEDRSVLLGKDVLDSVRQQEGFARIALRELEEARKWLTS